MIISQVCQVILEKVLVSVLLLLFKAAPGSYVLELGLIEGLLENISDKVLDKSLLLAVTVLIIIKKYNKFYDNNDSSIITYLNVNKYVN